MADRFGDWGLGTADPLTVVERSTHSAADFSPANTTRCLGCDVDGVLKVDTLGGDTNVAIQVFAGWNPVRVTKIYKTGSDAALIVDCWD